MMRFVLIMLLLLIISGCNKLEIGPTVKCTLDFPDSSAKHPKKVAYQAILDQYTRKGLPGIILLIHDSNGVWIGASGKADIEADVDMSPCMVSACASITKMMISTLVLKLVEEGTLDLDKKVSDYLPKEKIEKIANAREATLRQLLNHTSGIYDVISDNGFYLEVLNHQNKIWTPEEILKYTYGKPAYFPPGTDVHYSNGNYALISLLIDHVTKRNHADLLKEKIINPTGLKHTYYYRHDAIPEYVAQGYFDLYNNGTICNLTNYDVGNGNGYTGIFSNVHDLMIFIEALLVHKSIISQTSLYQMMTFTKVETGTTRACGLGLYKDFQDRDSSELAYGHRGRTLGYSADLFYFPKKGTTMAFLVNYGTDGSSNLKDDFFDFRDAVVDEIFR